MRSVNGLGTWTLNYYKFLNVLALIEFMEINLLEINLVASIVPVFYFALNHAPPLPRNKSNIVLVPPSIFYEKAAQN